MQLNINSYCIIKQLSLQFCLVNGKQKEIDMELGGIVEKLKEVLVATRTHAKIRDSDVAQALGIPAGTFASMKCRNSIPYQEISEFCAKNRISINWLLFDQAPESLVESTNKHLFVKYYKNINVSAGGGAINWDDSCELVSFERDLLEKIGFGIHEKHIEAINVIGDSMEPTFCDDDVIFINRDKKEISKGGVFVIATEAGVFVKRIQKRVDGRIDIISDNKDYAIQRAEVGEVEIIGRVVGRMGRA